MNWCNNCAMRLFNTRHYNLGGVGNIWSNRCIVLPNVDYSAYKSGKMASSEQLQILRSIHIPSTGELDSDCYVIPLIRCNESISCKLDDASYRNCLHYFADDIKKYQFKDILLLGDAGRRFLSIDISSNLNTCFISPNNRRYVVNYSPLIKHIDSNKFDILVKGVTKWYVSSMFDNFNNYDIIRL